MDSYVFCPLVELWVLGHRDGTIIIFPNFGGDVVSKYPKFGIEIS